MKWILITWLLHADGLPTMPISFSFYENVADCQRARQQVLHSGLQAVCREGRPIEVAKLKVVK